jgi:hypothetical protein
MADFTAGTMFTQPLVGNGRLNNTTRKDTQIKFYKAMAVPLLIYGSETWTITNDSGTLVPRINVENGIILGFVLE